MLFLSASALSGSATVTTPSGWTLANNRQSHGGFTMYHFYKIADGTETSVDITLSGFQQCNALYIELTGIAYTSPLDRSNYNIGTTNPASGTTLATTQANEFALATILTDDASAGTPSFSNSYTSNLRTALPLSVSHKFFYAYKHLAATGTQTTGFTDSSSGDYVGVITTYKGITTAAPDLNSLATYTCRVAAVSADGTVGQASDSVSIYVGTTGALTLYWDAPSGTTPDHYRMYFKRGSNAYKYFDTSNAYTVYTLTTETSASTGDPVLTTASGFGQYRLGTALTSGTVWHDRDWVSTSIGGTNWEIIDLGIVEGTEAMSLWGDDPIGWQWRVQCKHATDTPLMDVDCLWLLPVDRGDASLQLWYSDGSTLGPSGNLATSRDWRSDLRPDWLQSAVLLETGTTTEAGPVQFDGRLFIGPDACVLVICPVIGSLVSDVTDCQLHHRPDAYEISLSYTPRYLFADGGA